MCPRGGLCNWLGKGMGVHINKQDTHTHANTYSSFLVHMHTQVLWVLWYPPAGCIKAAVARLVAPNWSCKLRMIRRCFPSEAGDAPVCMCVSQRKHLLEGMIADTHALHIMLCIPSAWATFFFYLYLPVIINHSNVRMVITWTDALCTSFTLRGDER